MPERETRTITVDVAWTETANYSATIEVEIPVDMTDEEAIGDLLEEDDLWFEEVQKISGWPEKCLDAIEHRQALDYTIHDKE